MSRDMYALHFNSPTSTQHLLRLSTTQVIQTPPTHAHMHIQQSYTSLNPLFGISVSTISNPLRLGYRLLNVSTSQLSPVASLPPTCGRGFSLAVGAALVGDVAEPPVCRAFGLGGKRGAGPDGARTLITGGAEDEAMGGGMLGRMDAGFA
jgi:hypothetical protein